VSCLRLNANALHVALRVLAPGLAGYIPVSCSKVLDSGCNPETSYPEVFIYLFAQMKGQYFKLAYYHLLPPYF